MYIIRQEEAFHEDELEDLSSRKGTYSSVEVKLFYVRKVSNSLNIEASQPDIKS